MTLNLYNYLGKRLKIDKTLPTATAVQGELVDGASIENPRFRLQSTTRPNYNYFYSSDLGRYYFITGINYISGKLWEISGHTDVLKTFASAIKSSDAFVNYYSGATFCAHGDSRIPLPQRYQTIFYYPTLKTGHTWQTSSAGETNAKNNVIAIRGRAKHEGSLVTTKFYPYPVMTGSAVLIQHFNNEFANLSNKLTLGDKDMISNLIFAHQLPITPKRYSGDKLVDQIQLPNSFKPFSDPEVFIDTTPECQIIGEEISESAWSIDLSDYMWTGTEFFRNFSPFFNCKLIFPPFGSIQLDLRDLVTSDLQHIQAALWVEQNNITGEANLWLAPTTVSNTRQTLLASTNVKKDIPFLIESRNAEEFAKGIATAAVAGTAFAIGAGAAVGAFVGAESGALTLAEAGAMAEGAGTKMGLGIAGMAKGAKDMMSAQAPRMEAITAAPKIVDNPRIVIYKNIQTSSNADLIGRPYFTKTTIGALTSGEYIQLGEFCLENCNCIESERNEIERLLTSGVYI